MTRLLPASWCRLSTFCVMTAVIFPARSSSASAMWPGFGPHPANCSPNSRQSFQTFAGLSTNASIVAYSSGGYFAQIPFALRKSGMPLSVDIPAPVEAITQRPSRRIRAASPKSFVMAIARVTSGRRASDSRTRPLPPWAAHRAVRRSPRKNRGRACRRY